MSGELENWYVWDKKTHIWHQKVFCGREKQCFHLTEYLSVELESVNLSVGREYRVQVACLPTQCGNDVWHLRGARDGGVFASALKRWPWQEAGRPLCFPCGQLASTHGHVIISC